MMSASWEVIRVQIHFAHVHRCRFHPSEICKLLVPRPQHQLHSVFCQNQLTNYLKQKSTSSKKIFILIINKLNINTYIKLGVWIAASLND